MDAHRRAAVALSFGDLPESVKSRYPHDTLAPVRARHSPAGLAGGVDPVGFASWVGEDS